MRNREVNDHARVKVRVIEFEVEGCNASVQEGLRNIAVALKGNAAVTKTVTSSPGALPGSTAKKPAADQLELGENASADEVADESTGDPAFGAPAASPAAPRSPTSPRKLRTPKILTLDFENAPVSLKAFVTLKKPDSETKRYLVIAFWLKEHRKLDVITTDHIYTAYRTLGSNVIADVGSPFRNAKLQGWFEGKGGGKYEINHVGIGVVNRMPGS
jgi:hypothetical protein